MFMTYVYTELNIPSCNGSFIIAKYVRPITFRAATLFFSLILQKNVINKSYIFF
jgi:hypothetical protein